MISVIIPAYNEETNVVILTKKVIEQLEICQDDYEIIFIDDGSSDGTANKIKELHEQNPCIKLVSLSRNFGHQKALKAGIDHSSGDCVISMDADMQHPPELIPLLLEKWRQGYDIVYTIRKETKDARIFKRVTSKIFYWLINKLTEVNIKEGAADFRLMDKKVVNELKCINETFLFIRGLISWVGFKQIGIDYVAASRYSGVSKYSVRKMMKFAWDGITSFSILPLRFAVNVGATISILSFLYATYVIAAKFFTDKTIPGWTSLLISVLFLGGIQLLCIGILGEYLGKMFIESKRRQVYIVKDRLL
jgi:glycosyltransferase involved in cell wall biosynthesis